MHHCTRCRLEFEYTIEAGGIDVCPTCGSDMDLSDGSLPEKLKRSHSLNKLRNEFNIQDWKKKKEAVNAYEERRLAHYHDVYRTRGQEAADNAYWNYNEDHL